MADAGKLGLRAGSLSTRGSNKENAQQLPSSIQSDIAGLPHSTRDQADHAVNALEKVAGKWKLRIVFYLLDGKKRFSELRRLLPGISRGTLTFELHQLMEDGIIERTQFPTILPGLNTISLK